MGKRLIITGANFSSNGMKDNHTDDLFAPTAQGQVVPNASSQHYGKIGLNTNSWYVNKFVHSNKSILLYPGDTIALMNVPGTVATNGSIIAYKYAYMNDPTTILLSKPELYPIPNVAEVTQGATTGVVFGTVVGGTGASVPDKGNYPLKVTNTSSDMIWCIVLSISISTSSSSNVTVANTPQITYRIYGEDLTPYEE